MNWKFWEVAPAHPVDPLMDAVMRDMERVGPSHETYPKLLMNLKQLNELKTRNRRTPVSSDTIVIVLANLAGIGLIALLDKTTVLSPNAMKERIRPKNP